MDIEWEGNCLDYLGDRFTIKETTRRVHLYYRKLVWASSHCTVEEAKAKAERLILLNWEPKGGLS